jgi:AsmA protein
VTFNVLDGAVLLGHAVITVDGSLLEGKARLLATSPALTTADLPIIVPLRKSVEVKDLKVSMGMAGQQVEIDKISANAFGGQLLAETRTTIGSPRPPFDGNIRLQGMQLGPLAEALTDTMTGSGTVNAKLTVQGRGFSQGELRSGLEGTGSFTVKDGTIEGVNLLQEAIVLLKAAGIRLTAPKTTVFSTIDGRFGLKQGIIQIDRLFIDSHDFQAIGTGTMGLNHTLNLKAGLTLSEPLSKQIVTATPALRVAMIGNRMTVPMLITGTTQAPSYALDTKIFAGKIQEQVKEQVRGVVDDLMKGKKPDLEKGKEALKNLLGQ